MNWYITTCSNLGIPSLTSLLSTGMLVLFDMVIDDRLSKTRFHPTAINAYRIWPPIQLVVAKRGHRARGMGDEGLFYAFKLCAVKRLNMRYYVSKGGVILNLRPC